MLEAGVAIKLLNLFCMLVVRRLISSSDIEACHIGAKLSYS